MSAEPKNIHAIAITQISGIGDLLVRQLIAWCGSPEEVFKANKAKLLKIPGIGEKTAELILRSKADALLKAEGIASIALKHKHQVISIIDQAYPSRLKETEDAPCVFYFDGQGNLNHPRTIAIVGTRNATEYGREVVEDIIRALMPFNPLIVSGLAYGIDIAAHRAALKYGLPTLAVMATGLDKIYPAEHKKTAAKIQESFGLLTENIYGCRAEAHFFPARNRIIAGIADAVIVVEAAEKGGALLTANIANGYNRDVFAVPGPVNFPFSKGCNRLIADHKAACLAMPEDLITALNWDIEEGSKQGSHIAPMFDFAGLSPDEKTVVERLQKINEIHIDELARTTLVPINRLAGILLELEFKNLVKALPGKKFALTTKNVRV